MGKKYKGKPTLIILGLRGFPCIEGGVEKHCESLYPLISGTMDITVVRRKPYVNNKHYNQYKDIKFVDLPSSKIRGIETLMSAIIGAIYACAHHQDIAHIHNIGPAVVMPLLKLVGTKCVLTFHSANYEHEKWGRFEKKFLRFCEKIALNNADKIIFVNKFQMEKYPLFIQQKSVYLPNGINKVEKVETNNYIEHLGLKSNGYILSVGRITPEKGFDLLIDAFYKIKNKEIKLVIAGGVEHESKYKKNLEKMLMDDRVLFLGFVTEQDLKELYSNASLFVLASRNEGFPLVLLEAMSYGLDVAVSDIPGTHLVKLNDTDYFETNNTESIRKVIENKLNNPQKREYDLESHKWSTIANRTVEIYQSLIQG